MAKEKTILQVEDSVLKNQITDYKQKHDLLKDLEKESDSISKLIKATAETKWLELYKENESNPGTIVIEAEDIDGSMASITYIPSNRFTSITDKNKDSILSIVGSEYIETEVEYVIGDNIYDKYKYLINEFIASSDLIEPEDKLNFIKKVEKLTINKNIMDNLLSMNGSVDKVFEAIKPVFSIKDPIIS